MKIRYKKLVPEVKSPFRKYDDDAGYDLYAVSKTETEKYIEYGTGIAIEIPTGYVGLIFPRSSVTEKDLILKNCIGVIDAQYRGEIRCRFARIPSTEFKDLLMWREDEKENIKAHIEIIWSRENQYEIGERIVQLIIIPIPPIELVESDELSETERGAGSYGHTGK